MGWIWMFDLVATTSITCCEELGSSLKLGDTSR